MFIYIYVYLSIYLSLSIYIYIYIDIDIELCVVPWHRAHTAKTDEKAVAGLAQCIRSLREGNVGT